MNLHIKPIDNNVVNCNYNAGGGKIQWIDTAKALGLILVFWGHLLYYGTLEGVNQAIYSFHMPMYFILSGIVMRGNKLSFIENLRKRFNRLLKPSMAFIILSLPVYFLFQLKSDDPISIKHIISVTFYIHGMVAYNDPIWFFICMFQVLVIADALNLYDVQRKYKMYLLIGSFFAGYLLYKVHFVYFGLDKAIVGLGFFLTGQCLKDAAEKIITSRRVVIICLLLWYLAAMFLNTKVSMYVSNYGSYWCFVLSGISGSIAFCSFAKYLSKMQFINQYSGWTVFIVMSHYFLVTFFIVIERKIIGFDGTWIFDITSFAFVLLSLYLYRPICKFVDRRFPILNGK